jgi:hypothetical protein
MYTEKDNSAHLFLSPYTAILPVLGPCGLSRAEDSYEISTPRTKGKVSANDLKIMNFSDDRKSIEYTSYIEFSKVDEVLVPLFINDGGKQIPLTINGKHKLKVKANEIYKG